MVGPQVAGVSLQDPRRLRELRATGLLDGSGSAVLDRLTRLAGRLVDVPMALVSMVDADRQVFPSAVGIPRPGPTPLSHSFCQHVVAGDRPMIVTDARSDVRVRENPAVAESGVIAYAGFPLRSPQRQALGTFSVADIRPRTWTGDELAVLEDLAAAAEAEIAMRLSHAELLAESQRRQAILDAAADAFVTTDEHGVVLAWNAAAERLFGWDECEALGRPLAELVAPPRQRAEAEARLRKARTASSGGRRVEVPAVDRHGRQFPAEVSLRACATGGELQFYGFLHDLTDRRDRERSRGQSRAAFEASPLGMAITDDQGRYARVNTAYARMLGADPGTLVGVDSRGFTDPDDVAATDREVTRVLADPRVAGELETRLVRSDGARVWTATTITAISGPDGERQLLVQAEDITGRRQAREHAARETDRLRTIIAVQREVSDLAADRDRMLPLVAERALEALAGADAAMVGMVDGDEIHAAAATGVLRSFAGARVPVAGSLAGLVVTSGTTLRCDDTATDDRVGRADGIAVTVGSMIVAPLFADGEVFGTLGVSSRRAHAFDDADTEHLTLLADALTGALRHAEATRLRVEALRRANEANTALQDSEARFRSAFEASPLGMVLTDLAPGRRGVVLRANAAMAAITGYPVSALTGMRIHEFHDPGEHDATDETLRLLVAGDTDRFTTVKRYRHADGHTLWVRVNIAVIRDDHGEPRFLVSQVEDITQRRETAQQLRQRAQLLDLTQDAVIVRDLGGRVTYWNPAAERVYGWPADVARGQDLDLLLGIVPESVDRTLDEEGTWAGELEHRRADGSRVTVLARKALQRDADGQPVAILSINTDVTARRTAELALKDSEQRFRTQFAHSAIGQVIRGTDDLIQEVNPAFAAMIGYPAEQLVGTRASSYIDPEAHPERARSLVAVHTGGADSYRQHCRLLCADGGRVDVDATVSVIRDDAGEPVRFVALFQDITARIAAEAARDAAIADLADRNLQLEDANQLKQDLIGMLGHEIGNPLSSILGYTETITGEGENLPPEVRRTMLAAVDRNARQLNDIVREVLTMVTLDAGRLTASPEPVILHDHLHTALSNSGAAGTTVDCPAGLVALVQPGHLAQILANLLSNAAKYGGGATAITGAADGDRVRIAVHDAGPGVPDDLRDHLFDRFTRATGTAATVKGTGLGLHIVRELARANHGDIHHEPAPGHGSVFVLTVPSGALAGV
ncbi:PAS domain S-box protein [Actinoplanes subglobosus]|uniref:histidine kinase n=1 Tax=Actinoplanes subglobosus TaxID=1547892 RepID=A0ABV8IVY9_9ACTN